MGGLQVWPCRYSTSREGQLYYVVKATITQRNATTVYDLNNGTIISVYGLDNPIPTDYAKDDFLNSFYVTFGNDLFPPNFARSGDGDQVVYCYFVTGIQ